MRPRRVRTDSSSSLAVFVEAPARLHFGMLDLRGALGRRFGGIGAAVPNPSLLIEAARASSLTAEGPSPAANRAVHLLRFYRRASLKGTYHSAVTWRKDNLAPCQL